MAVVIVVILVALGAAVVLLRPVVRSRRLRARFGPEYDRIVAEVDNRRAAERELTERERRHAALELRELSPERRDYFTRAWATVQERFVDQPADSVGAADALLTALMSERGYPTEGFDQQVADLSVEHGATLGRYRTAHDIAVAHGEGKTTTEDLRTAIVYYRALFLELVDGTAKPATGTDRDAIAHEQVSTSDIDRAGVDAHPPKSDPAKATAGQQESTKNDAAHEGAARKKDAVA
nr:hypothetical protein [Nocardia bovistercoris]